MVTACYVVCMTADSFSDLVADYHAHLDKCWRCREHPFDLCAEGARLLSKAVAGPAVQTTVSAAKDLC